MMKHSISSGWESPPIRPVLEKHQVHLWLIWVNQAIAHLPQLRQLLSADEQARADRFYFERDRHRFTISRARLRQILSQYLDIPAEHLQFCYGTYGKPSLAGSLANTGLQFNLAHSGEAVLCAVTCDRHIGVDVEQVRPLPKVQQLAERCLSAQEKIHLTASSCPEETFFAYWTCKEAYLKAIGSGLTQPMDQIEFALTPTIQLMKVLGSSEAAKLWSLQLLNFSPDYKAALAVEGQDYQLMCWQV
ncbi:MAG: 4'-phosphopantetheinyl transferase superfamily protein [Leptolyngbyaceae cyanobacterium RM2_2_4]|nr:4'-phosphopantetheinyl transferase superfamily protein [Leptolyngbyaceae cyanobacterium RM2_2_4]